VKAAGKSFSLSYKILTPSTLVVDFSIPAGQTLNINGLKAEGVTCTGHDFVGAGGTITYDQSTQQTINSTAAGTSITCIRTPSSAKDGQSFYAEKAVILSTNVGNLDAFWPQDSTFPITTASTI
jgi:hypothetical protein